MNATANAAPSLCLVRLHGGLAKQFGKTLRLGVRSVGEAIRAIESQRPGFANALRQANAYFRVRRNGVDVGEKEINIRARMKFLDIIPTPAGAGNAKGIITLILGVILTVVSFGAGAAVFGAYAATAAGIGISLTLSGLASLLTRTPNVGNDERPDNKASYLFNGPVNTIRQGGPVALIYGDCIVGSQVISASVIARDIETAAAPTGGSSSSGGSGGIGEPIYSEN